ncbi:Rieske (2Fe-2S) protein [[Eubacterium] cellulosolvens]
MNDSSWIFAIEDDKLMEDSMHVVFLKGIPILLIKKENKIYALSNKCAHMACPLSGGTLEGYIITCPMHHVQFDVTTGEALSLPIPHYFGKEPMPDKVDEFFKYRGELSKHIKVRNLKTYPVKIDGDFIKIDIKTC